MTENNTAEKKNDTLAFIIGGLFILGLVFATYNYFNETGSLSSEGEDNGAISLERLKETLSTRTTPEGDNDLEDEENEEATEAPETSQEETITTDLGWTPNQYEEGEINPGEYEVQYGDTLWEIAEAAYGNGALWTQILEANSASVGYLPNGQQALIYAGQTLTIPAL